MANEDVDMTGVDSTPGPERETQLSRVEVPSAQQVPQVQASHVSPPILSDGCPSPSDAKLNDNLVAIVGMGHEDAYSVNFWSWNCAEAIMNESDSHYEDYLLGCNIFLQRSNIRHQRRDDQTAYTFGRHMESFKENVPQDLDVVIPNANAARKQFRLVPTRENGHDERQTGKMVSSWRIESMSETITTVNGVPIQKQTSRTKKNKVTNPHAVYLDDSRVNTIDVLGTKIEIWLVRKADFILDVTPKFQSEPLSATLQLAKPKDHGKWALSRHILHSSAEPISNRSYRVLQRFSGRVRTAKLFDGTHARRNRDREFRKFYKKIVHYSLVQYYERTTIDDIPAIITDSYDGMVPYGFLQPHIKAKHPTLRFMTASALIRPIFSALEFLHYHRIVHDSDNFWNSVLIRIEDNRVFKVLLVDYSTTHYTPPEEEMPQYAMINDSRMAMELIEDCCNIWTLRNVPAPHAVHEDEMRRRTERAEDEWKTQNDACRYYFVNRGDDRNSPYGKKMLKVLAQKEMIWSRSKKNQLDNAGRLQIGLVTSTKLQEVVRAWEDFKKKAAREARSSRQMKIEYEEFPMVLTLGHKFLDDLANKLYHTQWDLLPRNICTKLRSLEGEIQNPWRTFTVTRKVKFQIRSKSYAAAEGRSRLVGFRDYLATCCDTYPESRDKIHAAFADIVQHGESIEAFLAALKAKGMTSPAVHGTLQTLHEAGKRFDEGKTLDKEGTQFEVLPNNEAVNVVIAETHCICYHVPSGMFNATQLHNILSTAMLEHCVANQDIRCEGFVEVRGEPSIQGHFIPLTLLPKFAEALEITVSKKPEDQRPYKGDNPSDFSQITPSRVVLAHSGLVAFASVSRTCDQFSHLPTSLTDFESADPFLPTYFGEMKVLSSLPGGRIVLKREDHWIKFKRAEHIVKIVNWSGSRTAGSDTSNPLSEIVLKRGKIISRAHPPPRLPVEKPEINSRELKGPANLKRENFGLTEEFFTRNPNLMRDPPNRGFDPGQPFKPISRRKTTRRERRRFRLKSKAWAAKYVSDQSDSSSEDDHYGPPNPTEDQTAPLLDPAAQAMTTAGESFEPPRVGKWYGANWIAARQAPPSNGTMAATAGLDTEVADTVMMEWGSDVEVMSEGSEDVEAVDAVGGVRQLQVGR